MIILWMLYATVVGALLAAAAHGAEQLAATWQRPRRWVWFVAALALPLAPLTTSVRRPVRVEVEKTTNTAMVRASSATTPAASSASLPSTTGVLSVPPQPRRALHLPDLARLDVPLLAVWGTISALLLAGYLSAGIALLYHRRRWRQASLDGDTVLVSAGIGPAVVGAIRPRIVLPAWALTVDAPARSLILAHEREHLRARDPLLLHAVTVLTYVLPWNLPLWWILRRLQLAIELDCDARVLHAGADTRRYADLLLDAGYRQGIAGRLVAPALVERKSFLFHRILAMHARRPRLGRVRGALATGTVGTLFLSASVVPVPVRIRPVSRPAAAHLAASRLTIASGSKAADYRGERNAHDSAMTRIATAGRQHADIQPRRDSVPATRSDTAFRYSYHMRHTDNAGKTSEFRVDVAQATLTTPPIVKVNGVQVELDSTGGTTIKLPDNVGRITISRDQEGRTVVDDGSRERLVFGSDTTIWMGGRLGRELTIRGTSGAMLREARRQMEEARRQIEDVRRQFDDLRKEIRGAVPNDTTAVP